MKYREKKPYSALYAGIIPYLAVVIGLYCLDSAVVAIFLYHLAILIFMILTKETINFKKVVLGYKAPVMLLMLPLYALPGFLMYFLWQQASLDGLVLQKSLDGLGLGSDKLFWFILYYVTINPLLEELFWRGALNSNRTKEKRFPVAEDVLFGGYHGLVTAFFIKPVWVVFTVALLIAAAWVWRVTARYCGGLLVPWVTHTAANISVMTGVLYILKYYG